jgi:hypothetical protein
MALTSTTSQLLRYPRVMMKSDQSIREMVSDKVVQNPLLVQQRPKLNVPPGCQSKKSASLAGLRCKKRLLSREALVSGNLSGSSLSGSILVEPLEPHETCYEALKHLENINFSPDSGQNRWLGSKNDQKSSGTSRQTATSSQ